MFSIVSLAQWNVKSLLHFLIIIIDSLRCLLAKPLSGSFFFLVVVQRT